MYPFSFPKAQTRATAAKMKQRDLRGINLKIIECIATLGGRQANKDKNHQKMKLADQDSKMALQTEAGYLK